MEKKERKVLQEKSYYSIYDNVACDYSDLWSSQNNASALRCFKHTIATQLKQGSITNPDDYILYHVCDVAFYDDKKVDIVNIGLEVFDNEENNSTSDNTEVIINNV